MKILNVLSSVLFLISTVQAADTKPRTLAEDFPIYDFFRNRGKLTPSELAEVGAMFDSLSGKKAKKQQINAMPHTYAPIHHAVAKFDLAAVNWLLNLPSEIELKLVPESSSDPFPSIIKRMEDYYSKQYLDDAAGILKVLKSVGGVDLKLDPNSELCDDLMTRLESDPDDELQSFIPLDDIDDSKSKA